MSSYISACACARLDQRALKTIQRFGKNVPHFWNHLVPWQSFLPVSQLCFHCRYRPRNEPLHFCLGCLPRKEVIQPHLPIRLPCYDFTPVIGLTFGGCSLRLLTDFGCSQLPWCDGRCVQGPGTYSPRHADPRLLATPTSRGRVAAHDPNWDHFFEISSSLRIRCSLLWPL